MTRRLVRVMPRPPLSEIDFQRQLVGTKPPGLAVLFGWEHVHFRPAMTKFGWRTAGTGSLAAGWPDLILARPRDCRVIAAELKRDGVKPSPEQERVLEVLGASGLEVYVWHPSDWAQIEAVLR